MALQSKLFRGDHRLEASAVVDTAHILPGANGPHVGKIQQALIQVDGASLPQDSVYGTATAAAVRAFKQKRQILNFQGRIDDIVGKKTIAALDAELLAKESGGGGLRLGFKIGEESISDSPSKPVADIIVRFAGAPAAGSMPTDDVIGPGLFPEYQRLTLPNNVSKIGFFGRILKRSDTGRFLLRLGRSTNTVGASSNSLFIEVAFEIVTLLTALNLVPGKIYIFGSSSGGRNAIDFAAHLTRLGFKPHLAAAIDAPFFQPDTATRPADGDDKTAPKTIPQFAADAGTTPNRFNFFQTIGNHVKSSRNPFKDDLFFTSDMSGEEIHGEITGFSNIPLNDSIKNPNPSDDNSSHEKCGDIGTNKAREMIARDIRTVPQPAP